MADDFLVNDNDTPTEADLDQAYGSKFRLAVDVGNRRVRTPIVKVRKMNLRGSDGTNRVKFVLDLGDGGKPMVVNATNMNELVEKLGRDPAKWKGAWVELYVDPNVTYAGKRVAGLRLRALGPGTKPAVSAGSPEPPPHDGTGIEDMSDGIPV